MFLPDFAGILFMAAFVAFFAMVHVKLERTIHFWDFGTYHDMATTTANEFRSSLREGMESVRSSLSGDRPALWVLPLLPAMIIGADTRHWYVGGLALAYHLPYLLLLGGLGAALMRGSARALFWGCSILALLLPAVWMPTLLGFPDVSSAAMIAAAMLLYVHPATRERKFTYAGIGIAVALAVLFRRHYAYTAIAFFVALALDTIVVTIGGGHETRRRAFRQIVNCTIAGLSALVVMLTLGLPFTLHALSMDVSVLYSSYEVSPLSNLAYFSGLFGSAVVVFSLAGWIAAFVFGTIVRDRARPLALFFALEVILWFLLVRETNPQFILHFTTFIVLGLAFGVWTLAYRLGSRWRLWIPIAAAGLLGPNLFLSLVPASRVADVPGRSWWVARHRPLQRSDYDEVFRLLEKIREYAGTSDPVYVAASSWVLNISTLRTADQMAVSQGRRVRFARIPNVDSRDFFPLSSLTVARFVVLATPVQYHLRPEEQDVVRFAHETLSSKLDIGRDFEKLPDVFMLEGATVEIYRRVRSSDLSTAIAALDRMKRELGQRPAEQADWISLGSVPGAGAEIDGAGTRLYVPLGSHADGSATFVYLSDLPPQYTLTGVMRLPAGDTLSAGFRLSVLDETGSKWQVHDSGPELAEGRKFEVALNGQKGHRLILEPYSSTPPERPAQLDLRSVRIEVP